MEIVYEEDKRRGDVVLHPFGFDIISLSALSILFKVNDLFFRI